jgi:hypothetical protein
MSFENRVDSDAINCLSETERGERILCAGLRAAWHVAGCVTSLPPQDVTFGDPNPRHFKGVSQADSLSPAFTGSYHGWLFPRTAGSVGVQPLLSAGGRGV